MPEQNTSKPNRKRRYLLILFFVLALIAALAAGLFIAWYLSSKTTPQPEAITETEESPVATMHRYKVAYLQEGEIYGSDLEGDPVKLTSTDGKVVNFAISPNKEFIVYAVSNRDLVTPIAKTIQAQLVPLAESYGYSAEQIASIQSDNYFNLDIAAEAYKLTLNSGEVEKVINWEDFTVDSDVLLALMAGVPEAVWLNNQLTLGAIDSTNTMIAYHRRGIVVTNLATGQPVDFASNPNAGISGSMCYTAQIEWIADNLRVTYPCWEWAQQEVYKLVEGQFTAVAPDLNIVAGMGSSNWLIGLDSHGDYILETTDFATIPPKHDLSLYDVETGANTVLIQFDGTTKAWGTTDLQPLRVIDDEIYFFPQQTTYTNGGVTITTEDDELWKIDLSASTDAEKIADIVIEKDATDDTSVSVFNSRNGLLALLVIVRDDNGLDTRVDFDVLDLSTGEKTTILTKTEQERLQNGRLRLF